MLGKFQQAAAAGAAHPLLVWLLKLLTDVLLLSRCFNQPLARGEAAEEDAAAPGALCHLLLLARRGFNHSLHQTAGRSVGVCWAALPFPAPL